MPHGLISVAAALALLVSTSANAQTVSYHVTIPEPQHHWLQVEAVFPDLGAAPLRAFMSRSSPGRYAVHEFAKNVFWVEAYDAANRPVAITRPNPYEWDVAAHGGAVRLVYKVFGDLVDGTYLAVDATHAHINMPAAFMFDRDRQDRPVRVTFTPPSGTTWTAATQLYPTNDPFTFTAPNLQYFMDSPAELSNLVTSTFTLPNASGGTRTFRLAVHADASQGDVDDLAALVRRLLRTDEPVFGEFPAYEPGTYTFLLDYQPHNGSDGMEHRNSTVITQASETLLRSDEGRRAALGTISHEFFHNWNVERIRPAGLEPFDFTQANITCCLWLAEGFTQYYGPLLLMRAGLSAAGLPANPVPVIDGSGRQVRSPVQMSEYAPFADAARSIDPTDQSRSFISYYTYGAAVALALDLSLRAKSDSKISLDDFMRRLWQQFGAPGGAQPGLVAHPYSLRDLRAVLAEVSGDRAFADEFFDRFIEGREVPDYANLLARAGFALRAVNPRAGWAGAEVQSAGGGLTITGSLVGFSTPAYEAGLERDDLIKTIDGAAATMEAWNAMLAKGPGTQLRLGVVHRGSAAVATINLTLVADPSLQVVDLGTAMTPQQRQFREGWLGGN